MISLIRKAGEQAGKKLLQQAQKATVSPPFVPNSTGKSTSASSTSTGSKGTVTVSPPFVPNGTGKSTSASSTNTGSKGKVTVSPPFVPSSTASSSKGKSTSASSTNTGSKNHNWQTDPVTGLITIAPFNADYTPAAESSIIGKSSKGLAPGEKSPEYKTYEEAAAAAEKLGEEVRKKQRKYDRDYAWRDNPESAAGYDLAVLELDTAKSARDKALEFMREHSAEAAPSQNIRVEGDVTSYRKKLEEWQKQREEEAARSDPDVRKLKRLDGQIAAWKKALGEEENEDDPGFIWDTPEDFFKFGPEPAIRTVKDLLSAGKTFLGNQGEALKSALSSLAGSWDQIAATHFAGSGHASDDDMLDTALEAPMRAMEQAQAVIEAYEAGDPTVSKEMYEEAQADYRNYLLYTGGRTLDELKEEVRRAREGTEKESYKLADARIKAGDEYLQQAQRGLGDMLSDAMGAEVDFLRNAGLMAAARLLGVPVRFLQAADAYGNAAHEASQNGGDVREQQKQGLEAAKAALEAVKNSEIEKERESGIINADQTSRTAGKQKHRDPMRDIMGSAFDSHEDEVDAILQKLTSLGVTIHRSNTTMGYQPSNSGGPGQIGMPREASYSAWLHEAQHAQDDYESGWNGYYILYFDPEEHINWERRAFQKEIDFAISSELPEAVKEKVIKELEGLLDEQIRKIRKHEEEDTD